MTPTQTPIRDGGVGQIAPNGSPTSIVLHHRARMDIGAALSLLIAAALFVSVASWRRQRAAERRARYPAEREDRNTIANVNHWPGAARNLRVVAETQVQQVDWDPVHRSVRSQ
ncbi:hypothetical protein KG112_10260 [Nocardioides sp. zg-ZUI104]|uniref:hypothetical protein n=1 Tax=Nocardioides faecalis TaxID=2803858 RepID=UPI001BD07A82|nr:hypothetical protein [Nocardioides faecalis]MBS4753186.1 hypothetical protein [Nocardioides faecalis]